MAQSRVVLGVCGGIAAYKSVYLLRRFKKAGYDVTVVPTREALHFIGAATWAALSGKPVYTDLSDANTGEWHNHVKLASEADLLVVAPLTANTLAKWVHGICDNLLLAVLQSSTAPIFAAPAMDREMYVFPPNQENLRKLQRMGVHILPPEAGPLASGEEGFGRMAEPDFIFDRLEAYSPELPDLNGAQVVLTAGPTREYLDPVRFLSNPSSGRMAFALAHAFRNAGAEVHVICGPVQQKPPHDCTVEYVETASEMLEACLQKQNAWDIFVGVAAVSDFSFRGRLFQKIKKENLPETLPIQTNPDILATIASARRNGQMVVGFALETENVLDHARLKLHQKNLDMIVANDASEPDAAFGAKYNHVWVLDKNGEIKEIPHDSKNKVAAAIVTHIGRYFQHLKNE
jgi:phosphopantothenoylcysteine decarboxylase/phosphopantothenate--cysteine ligase